MNRQLVTFCLLLIFLNIQSQNLGTISGKVFNNENGLILEGATVQVEDSDFFAITNSEGLFEIKDIPTSSYNIKASFVGFKSQTIFNVIVKSAGNQTLLYGLNPSSEELEEVIRFAKKHCPKYVRISRIFRDIPVDNIIGGADIPHMRQKIQRKMAKDGEFCKCIRCREIKNRIIDVKKVFIEVDEYEAQGGREFFISANYKEDETKEDSYLVGFCKMRIDSSSADDNLDYLPNLKGAAKVRELHVYGKMVPSYLSKFEKSNSQHRGIGSQLLKIAENIAFSMVLGGAAIKVTHSPGRESWRRRGPGGRLQRGVLDKGYSILGTVLQ